MKLTDEELLKTLEQQEFKEEKKQHDIDLFLTKYNIQPGQDPIKITTLYKLFTKFSKERLTTNQFHDILELRFSLVHRKQSLQINKSLINDELLYLLKPKQTKEKDHLKIKHFQSFINKYQLKSGNVWVSLNVLYYLYDKWAYSIGKMKQLEFLTFNALLSVYFKKKNLKLATVFGIDDSIFNHITQQEIEEIQLGKQKRQDKCRRKRRK